MAAVVSPSSTYMFLEWGIYQVEPAYATSPSGQYYLPGVGQNDLSCGSITDATSALGTTYVSDCEKGRHLGGVIIGFAVGHVKWLKTSEVLAEARKYLNNNPKVSAFNPDFDNS